MHSTHIRQRSRLRHHLTTWSISIAAGLLTGGLLYGIAIALKWNSSIDRALSLNVGLIVALIVHIFLGIRWMKLPDGNYYRLTGISKAPARERQEGPAAYDFAYYPSTKERIENMVSGLALTGISIWLLYLRMGFMPIFLGLGGVALMVSAVKKIQHRKIPELQLSAAGIWTRRLGFLRWEQVQQVQLTSDNVDVYLEIFLPDETEEHDDDEVFFPAEKLMISELKDHLTISDRLQQLANGKFRSRL